MLAILAGMLGIMGFVSIVGCTLFALSAARLSSRISRSEQEVGYV